MIPPSFNVPIIGREVVRVRTRCSSRLFGVDIVLNLGGEILSRQWHVESLGSVPRYFRGENKAGEVGGIQFQSTEVEFTDARR